jgi:hypothetical protein
MRLWVPAAVAFLLAGTLEIAFLGLSLLGTLAGGGLTVLTLMGEVRGDEAIVGPLLLVFYGLWLVCTGLAGPLHLVAGASLVAGKRWRPLLWAATGASLLPVVTVYCATTSLIAGTLGLLLLVLPDPDAAKGDG